MNKPKSLDKVFVRDRLSPSSLNLVGCHLKLLIDRKKHTLNKFPVHPKTKLGTAIHELLEWADNKKFYKAPSKEEIRDLVHQEYNRKMQPIVQEGAFSKSERQNLSSWAILLAMKKLSQKDILEKKPPSRNSNSSNQKPQKRQYKGFSMGKGDWSEIEVLPNDIPVKGSIDRLEQTLNPPKITILDYKTGLIFDGENIKQSIQDQMLTYAAAVRSIEPRGEITLVIQKNKAHTLDVDQSVIDEKLEELRNLSLPVGEVDAKDYATPSTKNCYYCSIRHVCPAYEEEAPIWRQMGVSSDDNGRIPHDFWGTIKSVKKRKNTYNLVVADASGHQVTLKGIRFEHFGEATPKEGQYIWVYGLQADLSKISYDNKHIIDKNPWEMPAPRSGVPRAWSVMVFLMESI